MMLRSAALRALSLVIVFSWGASSVLADSAYDDWANANALKGANANPRANPDADRYPNALEYAFGTDPNVAESNYVSAPALVSEAAGTSFRYRVKSATEGIASYRVLRSTDAKKWTTAPGAPVVVSDDGDVRTYLLPIPAAASNEFYQLEVAVPFTSATPPPKALTISGNIGKGYWELPEVATVVIRTEPPGVVDGPDKGKPDYSKYPSVIGSSLTSWTDQAEAEYVGANKTLPRRTWLGWFLWGNGTPPPGVNPGYPVTGNATTTDWDYNSFIYSAGDNATSSTAGWRPTRLDQQPLYAMPLVLNYNWPPAMFGFVKQPLLPIETAYKGQFGYWSGKKIVRGVNLSQQNPFFYQYGNLFAQNPAAWQQLWMRCMSRPLETTVIVPSNKTPNELLGSAGNGTWNGNGTQSFPYPMWDANLSPAEQTPFNIKVDRLGDFDADIVWEGANARLSDAKTYAQNRYVRTKFAEPGRGNYLKMTVAQGSPLVWCESNNNKYAIFYNLVRVNVPGQIDNPGNQTLGSKAATIAGGDLPNGVSYVLLYGDHTNPNQWYHEVPPQFPDDAGLPGGFNPPGKQHNHTYTAIFYRTDTAEPITLGDGGKNSTANNGTDADGNPYFYLQFKSAAKNWFVVGAVPAMRYYNTDPQSGGIAEDSETDRVAAAKAWAEEMAKYAFNFSTGTAITYAVKNIYRTETTYAVNLTNPFLAKNPGDTVAEKMTTARRTVLAVPPHSYQPITLGPDLTKKPVPPATTPPQVVWNPLVEFDAAFPVTKPLANANKNNKDDATGRWEYWTHRGNAKTIVTQQFTTAYPVQNLLPLMPSPDYAGAVDLSGIQAINVTSLGDGTYTNDIPPPTVSIRQVVGTGAQLSTELAPNSTQLLSIKVDAPGSGYVDGNPAPGIKVTIDPPTGANPLQATARAIVKGGKIVDVQLTNSGSGYGAAPGAVIQPNLGTGASLAAQLDPNTGQLTYIQVNNGGTGYPAGNPAPMDIVISDPTAPAPNAGGRVAKAFANVVSPQGGDGVTGSIVSVTLSDPGFGYAPTITVNQTLAGNQTIDAPVIVPSFQNGKGPMQLGSARIISAGAGFAFSDSNNLPQATVWGTGTGAKADVLSPGSVVSFTSGITASGGSTGRYPYSGNLTKDLEGIIGQLPPTTPGGSAPATKWAAAANINKTDYTFALTNAGMDYSPTTPPEAYFMADNNVKVGCIVNIGGPKFQVVGLSINGSSVSGPLPPLSEPTTVHFSSGNATATVYSTFSLAPGALSMNASLSANYPKNTQVSFIGGSIETSTAALPTVSFNYTASGNGTLGIDPASLKVVTPGKGWTYAGSPAAFANVLGGRGFDAVLRAVLGPNGEILRVVVLDGGTNYPDPAASPFYAIPNDSSGTGANLTVSVDKTTGAIARVDVAPNGAGSGYKSSIINLSTSRTQTSNEVTNNPKGLPAQIGFELTPDGGLGNATLVRPGYGYLADTQTGATPESPGIFLDFSPSPGGLAPAAITTGRAGTWVGLVMRPNVSLQQVAYDSIIYQYSQDADKSTGPFGAGYEGGAGIDGYALAEKTGATGKLLGDMFNFQQHLKTAKISNGSLVPSGFAFEKSDVGVDRYQDPAFLKNSPIANVDNGLKLAVQGLQRSLTRLFDTNIASNSISANNSASAWQMSYFNLYDFGVGRTVVNPSTILPSGGWMSSILNPPALANGNLKGELAQWTPGKLWSGFGVSDQWNDQHYFFGYFLTAAALAGIFDYSWLDDGATPPADQPLWASRTQMGTAIDQWLMTVAYDPAIDSAYYKMPAVPGANVSYQKFAFFDQWNGHGWASGVAPGVGGTIYDGGNPAEKRSEVNVWLMQGKGSGPFGDENENSIFEGLQAWSGTALWGGATDRKPIFDLGIYLLSNEMAAGDAYFLDKNYNLTTDGAFSWAPVTTVDSSQVTNNGGNTGYKIGTDFTRGNPEAFWKAPAAFGGAASAGSSIVLKSGNSVDTFFYGYPTGPKAIQAFPPAPWTLSMSRNSLYMKKWAGALMRQEWTDMLGTGLFNAPDWIALAMSAAVCGVPYFPGDQPFKMTDPVGTKPRGSTYIQRLLAQWVTLNNGLGASQVLNSAFNHLSTITFLLALDQYGTPDWTYIAKATDENGTEDDASILFTATFSKVITDNGVDKVKTTFFAFNPGWNTRYVKFYRLSADGTPATQPSSGDNPVILPPKRLTAIPADLIPVE